MSCGGDLSSDNPISMIRGSSRTLELHVVDTEGNERDITDARVLFTVKRAMGDTQPLIQKDSVDPLQIELVAPRTGRARIYLYPADTRSLSARAYPYDVWVLLDGKNYCVIPPSEFKVEPSVTQVP